MASADQAGSRRHAPRPTLSNGVAIATLVALSALGLPVAAYAQSTTLQGTVTNSATGQSVAGAFVTLAGPTGLTIGTVSTNAAGQYSIGFLPPATYYMYVTAAGLLGEFHNNLPCPVTGCVSVLAPGSTPLTLMGGTATVNVSLDPAASISGTVTAVGTGAEIAGVQVVLWVAAPGGGVIGAGSSYTGAGGVYTIAGLPPGSYWLSTNAPAPFVDEWYGDQQCLGPCGQGPEPGGVPVTVGVGQPATGRDFALAVGGRLTGKVTRASSGAPAASVAVRVYAAAANRFLNVGTAVTDAAGDYQLGGLADGRYQLATDNTLGLIDEVFDDLPCTATCGEVFSGTDVVVTGAGTAVADFRLADGGTIAGTVRDAATSAPIGGVLVTAYSLEGDRVLAAATVATDGAGAYAIGGLANNAYVLATSNSAGYIDEVHDNRACVGDCGDEAVAGDPIQVTAGATNGGRDFALTTGGAISGVVTEAGGAPLQGVGVVAVARIGGRLQSELAGTDSNGAYTISGLVAGTYRLYTSDFRGFVNEIFGDLACFAACDPLVAVSQGTPVVVATGATTAGRNFSLAAGAQLSGIVTNAATQQRIAGATVRIYVNSGGAATLVASPATDALGRYVVTGLPAAQYYAATAANYRLQYVNEIHADLPCLGPTFCDADVVVSAGTPIAVPAAGTVTVSFGLQRRQEAPGPPSTLRAVVTGFHVVFSWEEPFSGGAPTSYVLEAGLTPGSTAISLAASARSLAVPGVPPGRFFLRVRAANAFGLGPPSEEIELLVAANGLAPPDPPNLQSAFINGSRLTLSWLGPFFGGPVASYLVEVGTSTGTTVIALPVNGRIFTYEPVPPGFYFLRVRAVNAAGTSRPSDEALVIAGSGPAPPGPPFWSTATVSGSTVTLTWQPPSRGPVTSYVLEAGSAPGLANIAVFNTGSAATSLTIPGVPPGRYYLRLRAANPLGASVVSAEFVLTVP